MLLFCHDRALPLHQYSVCQQTLTAFLSPTLCERFLFEDLKLVIAKDGSGPCHVESVRNRDDHVLHSTLSIW